MAGPVFSCILATQFSYARRGDRFWYELPNQPSSFTPGNAIKLFVHKYTVENKISCDLEQLREIRKARLARVVCDNTDVIDTIQLWPIVLPDHEM